MTTKLKIDLADGVLEVEGSEAFVKAIYNDFKIHFVGQETGNTDLYRSIKSQRRKRATSSKSKKSTPPAIEATATSLPADSKPVTPQASSSKVTIPKPVYTFIEDLNLAGNKKHASLVEYVDVKLPLTNEEKLLVFIHYLQHVQKIKQITIDHIFTCYKTANIRVPINIEKSIHMAANWINVSKTRYLTVSATGKRYVEKELPKKTKS